MAVSNQSTDEEQLADHDERVLHDLWSVLVSEWSFENGSQHVNEETAAVIEASSGDFKVLYWEFYMGFLLVVIFQFEKMWILLLSKFVMKAYANSDDMLTSCKLVVAGRSFVIIWSNVAIDRIMLYVTTNTDDNNEPQDNLQRDEVFLKERIPFRGCLVEWKGMERKE
ncbi:hypothetical protein Tco_0012787 [Tanacetum coccineum]